MFTSNIAKTEEIISGNATLEEISEAWDQALAKAGGKFQPALKLYNAWISTYGNTALLQTPYLAAFKAPVDIEEDFFEDFEEDFEEECSGGHGTRYIDHSTPAGCYILMDADGYENLID